MTRTDIHKPSLLDPAEYDFIAAFYQGDSPWMAAAYRDEHERYAEAIEEIDVFMGNFFLKNTCDHCGANFNHGVLFLHKPTDELIHVGHICAADTVGLPDKAAAIRRRAEKHHKDEREKAERRERNAGWREEHAEIIAWLTEMAAKDDPSNFIVAMVKAIEDWGALTPGQLRACEKWKAGDERRQKWADENEDRLKDAPPLVTGRREIVGTVISTKWADTQFGTTPKMLVQESDGNRIFGTIPANILPVEIANLVGEKVDFIAKVTRSDRDEHFGFFSRPTGGSLIR